MRIQVWWNLQLVQKSQADPDFWCYAGMVEVDVYEAVAARQLATRLSGLEGRYAELHGRVSASTLWGSVADQADFLLLPYVAAANGAEKAAAEALLKLLRGFAS